MKAQILNRPPISGEYEEHNFSSTNDVTWIKFTDNEYNEWCGAFEDNYEHECAIYKIPDEPSFWLVAQKKIYLINATTRNVVTKDSWQDIEDVIYNQNTGLLIVSDGLRLGTLDKVTLKWHTKRISADNLRFIDSTDAIITGKLNDLTSEGCEFTFDITTKKIKANWLFYKNFSY